MIAVMLNDGRVLNSTVSSTGDMLTIPANSTFTGDAFICASVAAEATARPRIGVVGTGGQPVNGSTIHQLAIAGKLGASASASGTIEIIIKTGANPLTLTFDAAGATIASATINGFIV